METGEKARERLALKLMEIKFGRVNGWQETRLIEGGRVKTGFNKDRAIAQKLLLHFYGSHGSTECNGTNLKRAGLHITIIKSTNIMKPDKMFVEMNEPLLRKRQVWCVDHARLLLTKI